MVSGDEKWIPMYWSTSPNPSAAQKNSTWRIGSGRGITEKKTYNMYIFFKKQIFKITPKLSPSDTDDKVSYSSSDSKIATVNAKGVITARKKGTATITVKSGKIQVKCKVTVK